ncbi:MAG: demethoxyubiquinone hydroxylase family protein [Alphaproteobacteria bacterium]|nr:demethoxyubiquinone hydroxylase family protein [Alphaproteobacteria bacterium]
MSRRRRPACRLPGDASERRELERLVRVDHAGEYGARQIYRGQLAILRGRPSGAVIARMAEAEAAHLAAFERLLAERRVRPTLLHPLWRAVGFLAGAGSALVSERAAMALTVGVEQAIDRHYARQAERLPAGEAELKALLLEFRAEELRHRDIALEHGAAELPGYALFRRAAGAGTRAAIWLSERL